MNYGENNVNHPAHYTLHPSGVECITITEHMNFTLGNAIKYIWRAGLKTADPTEDLQKAQFYLDREISKYVPKDHIHTNTGHIRAWRTSKNNVAVIIERNGEIVTDVVLDMQSAKALKEVLEDHVTE